MVAPCPVGHSPIAPSVPCCTAQDQNYPMRLANQGAVAHVADMYDRIGSPLSTGVMENS